MKITLGSLFDGIGGFPLAASRYGIKALWASEIEPFPIKVTKTRLADMKHLGDITKINGAKIEPVDIITFGSPCQDLSVAGKRAGLAGERSGLFIEAVRIIKELRSTYDGANEPVRPRFAVWENVPGAFSSNKGEDFRAVLEEICRVKDKTVVVPEPPKGKWSTVGTIMGNGYSIAWRVLDAQFWGVPQRRRRIFLVADFGGQSAPEILFKREGLSRYIAESGKARQGTATDAERSTPKTMLIRCGCRGGGKGPLIQDDKSATLSTLNIQTLFQPVAIENHPADSRVKLDESGTVQTLTTRMGTGGGNVPMLAVPETKVYGICSYASNSMKSDNPHSGIYEAETSRTIDLNGGSPACNQGGYESHPMDSRITGPVDVSPTVTSHFHKGSADTPLVQCIEPGALSRGQGERVWDKCPTLRANMGDNQPAIVHSIETYHCENHEEKASTLKARDWKDPQCVTQPIYALDRASFNQGENAQYDFQISEDDKTQTVVSRGPNAVAESPSYSVRRLTPLECERLQGFPDGWTDIPGQTEATQEELEFWRDVWVTWDKVQAEHPEKVRPRRDNALLKWLKNPVSDSAQYKALGNSVAVPCPEYVLEGISEVFSTER